MKINFKEDFKSVAKYFVTFFVAILYWELVLRLQMGGGIKAENFWFLFFVPAESLFFAMLCGFCKTKINRIFTPIVMFIVCFFYIAQLIYYRNFGSLFSIAMAGMGGDALGNFWWALKDTLVSSLGFVFLLLIPVIIVTVLCIKNKPKWKPYPLLLHAIALFTVVALWFLGILGLRIGGNDKQSAYYLYFNTLADTDTVSKKFGTMTTTVLEGGSFFFGIGNETTNLAAVNVEDTMLGVTTPATTTSNTAAVSDDTVTGETFVPVPYKYDEIDFNELKNYAADDKTLGMCDFFASRRVTSTNEYTGMFEGYNLIYICAEAFSVYALDENANPTLYKMANNGIVLNNFYNSFKNTTTNGEFAFATSLWPDVSRQATCGTDVGSFPQSSTKFMPLGLGDLFEAEGINTYAYHNYYGEYYRRALSWPNLGYKNIKFLGKGMHFTATWPASDYEMMQQSVDDYINEDQFHAYYMTFSGHGPYSSSNHIYNKNIGDVKATIGDRDITEEAKGYLAGNHELDKAMEYLLQRLEEAGQLDKTVIVICGDHYPYYMADGSVNSLAGHELDKNFEMYKSTCIIYNAGMEQPIYSDTYCCNVDIVPTMLNLFGIDFDSRLYMGTDIFDTSVPHKATIYNLNFITDLVQYNSSTGETIWSDAASAYSQDELDRYLAAMITLTESEYEASTNIINNNFYKFIWQYSGLLTPEEVAAEEARAHAVEQEASSINYRNAQRNAEQQALEKQQQQDNERNAAAARGWDYDPVTGLAVDQNSGIVYNPNTGEALGTKEEFVRKAQEEQLQKQQTEQTTDTQQTTDTP